MNIPEARESHKQNDHKIINKDQPFGPFEYTK